MEGIAVGRAAWGLYLILKALKKKGLKQKIALPSFLCQSPLAAILLADWEPVFCDVDISTGNVPISEWRRVLSTGVDAILFVHLFGNICDAEEIARLCRIKEIFSIEDICQSFGGSWSGKLCGFHGDAAILSFGHTKIIDVGSGGIVLTNDVNLAREIRNLDSREAVSNRAPLGAAENFRNRFFKAKTALATDYVFALSEFKNLIKIYQDLVPARWDEGCAQLILDRLSDLPELVSKRKEKNDLYMSFFTDSPILPLNLSPGSAPWRSVLRIPGINWQIQQEVSDQVRLNGVDISNWYIPSHWMMDSKFLLANELSKTVKLSKEIFQLWLDETMTKKEMQHAASNLLKVVSKLNIG